MCQNASIIGEKDGNKSFFNFVQKHTIHTHLLFSCWCPTHSSLWPAHWGSSPWNFRGKNTGWVAFPSPCIFCTHKLNPCSSACTGTSSPLGHVGSLSTQFRIVQNQCLKVTLLLTKWSWDNSPVYKLKCLVCKHNAMIFGLLCPGKNLIHLAVAMFTMHNKARNFLQQWS